MKRGITMEKGRPLGITIIAILLIINGIIFLVTGTGILIFLPFIGIPLIIIGIANLFVAWGLLKGKGWAWIFTLIVNGISIILNAVSIASGNVGAIVGIIINAVIIYYLYRPNVRSYFGRTSSPSI